MKNFCLQEHNNCFIFCKAINTFGIIVFFKQLNVGRLVLVQVHETGLLLTSLDPKVALHEIGIDCRMAIRELSHIPQKYRHPLWIISMSYSSLLSKAKVRRFAWHILFTFFPPSRDAATQGVNILARWNILSQPKPPINLPPTSCVHISRCRPFVAYLAPLGKATGTFIGEHNRYLARIYKSNGALGNNHGMFPHVPCVCLFFTEYREYFNNCTGIDIFSLLALWKEACKGEMFLLQLPPVINLILCADAQNMGQCFLLHTHRHIFIWPSTTFLNRYKSDISPKVFKKRNHYKLII